MKVIIAPSKTMKYTQNNLVGRPILFQQENDYLHNILKQYNDEDIMSLMKISYKQTLKVIDYYKNDKTYPALYLYSGTVFKQLELSKYRQQDFDYLDKHLNIMSAYYGILNYDSLITPYRLDMTMKPNNIDLYDYWFTPIYQYFEHEDFIISLASIEFSKMIKHSHLIFIDFIIIKNNKPTRNAMLVKKARGTMLNHMIINHIETIEEIKQIQFDGFSYHDELSNENTLVYIKELS